MVAFELQIRLHRRTYEVVYDNLMGLREWELPLIRQAGTLKAAILADPDRMLLTSIAWHDWKHPSRYRWKPGKPCLIRIPLYIAQVLYLNMLSLPQTVGSDLHLALLELDKRLTNHNIYQGTPFEIVS